MNKEKVIELINDIEADNFFNKDTECKNNIEKSLSVLKFVLGITQKDLKKDLENR